MYLEAPVTKQVCPKQPDGTPDVYKHAITMSVA